MAIGTFATSFLEHFGLRAFGGWQRSARPGMEGGMFAYDESTAELFEDNDVVEEATAVPEPVIACYVPVEPTAGVEAAVPVPSLSEETVAVDLTSQKSVEGVIVAGASNIETGYYTELRLKRQPAAKSLHIDILSLGGEFRSSLQYLTIDDVRYLTALFGTQKELFSSLRKGKLATIVESLQKLSNEERAVFLEALQKGREALTEATKTKRDLEAMMGAGFIASNPASKRTK